MKTRSYPRQNLKKIILKRALIDEGHLRILAVLARFRNQRVEDVINELIMDYNHRNLPDFVAFTIQASEASQAVSAASTSTGAPLESQGAPSGCDPTGAAATTLDAQVLADQLLTMTRDEFARVFSQKTDVKHNDVDCYTLDELTYFAKVR